MLETTLVQGVEPLAPAGTLFLWIYRTLSSTDDNENVLLRHVWSGMNAVIYILYIPLSLPLTDLARLHRFYPH